MYRFGIWIWFRTIRVAMMYECTRGVLVFRGVLRRNVPNTCGGLERVRVPRGDVLNATDRATYCTPLRHSGVFAEGVGLVSVYIYIRRRAGRVEPS